jgi:hypothetical protein
LFDIERVLDITLISPIENSQQEIVQRYELTVSVKAEDVIGNEYIRSGEWEQILHKHIASCGGMAVTSVSTNEK